MSGIILLPALETLSKEAIYKENKQEYGPQAPPKLSKVENLLRCKDSFEWHEIDVQSCYVTFYWSLRNGLAWIIHKIQCDCCQGHEKSTIKAKLHKVSSKRKSGRCGDTLTKNKSFWIKSQTYPETRIVCTYVSLSRQKLKLNTFHQYLCVNIVVVVFRCSLHSCHKVHWPMVC